MATVRLLPAPDIPVTIKKCTVLPPISADQAHFALQLYAKPLQNGFLYMRDESRHIRAGCSAVIDDKARMLFRHLRPTNGTRP